MKVQDETNTRVEYRYLPLSIDQWFKESQYAASDVMNSLIEDTNGYCDMGGDGEFVEDDPSQNNEKETDAPVFAPAESNGMNSADPSEPNVMFT